MTKKPWIRPGVFPATEKTARTQPSATEVEEEETTSWSSATTHPLTSWPRIFFFNFAYTSTLILIAKITPLNLKITNLAPCLARKNRRLTHVSSRARGAWNAGAQRSRPDRRENHACGAEGGGLGPVSRNQSAVGCGLLSAVPKRGSTVLHAALPILIIGGTAPQLAWPRHPKKKARRPIASALARTHPIRAHALRVFRSYSRAHVSGGPRSRACLPTPFATRVSFVRSSCPWPVGPTFGRTAHACPHQGRG